MSGFGDATGLAQDAPRGAGTFRPAFHRAHPAGSTLAIRTTSTIGVSVTAVPGDVVTFVMDRGLLIQEA